MKGFSLIEVIIAFALIAVLACPLALSFITQERHLNFCATRVHARLRALRLADTIETMDYDELRSHLAGSFSASIPSPLPSFAEEARQTAQELKTKLMPMPKFTEAIIYEEVLPGLGRLTITLQWKDKGGKLRKLKIQRTLSRSDVSIYQRHSISRKV